MSLLNFSKILLGLSAIALSAIPVLAIDLPDAKTATSPAAAKRPALIQRKQVLLKEVETAKEKLASRAAALKAKLQAFKDQKKVVIAERINTNLNAINQNETKKMQKHLNTMTNILDRLASRVSQGTADIKDPVVAKTAIASARISISTASAAVLAQAEKDYTIVVTSEARIKIDAKRQRDQLHADLLTLRKNVIDAKQEVANAIRVAKSGPVPVGTGLNKEGTASGQQ